MPHPCNRRRPGWMGLWAVWSSWRCPCTWQRAWTIWSLTSLPTQIILGFCEVLWRKLTMETWWTQLPQWEKPDTMDCLWQQYPGNRAHCCGSMGDNLHQHQYLGIRGMSNSRRHNCKRSAFPMQYRNYWNSGGLGFSWDKVIFLSSSWYGATFLI